MNGFRFVYEKIKNISQHYSQADRPDRHMSCSWTRFGCFPDVETTSHPAGTPCVPSLRDTKPGSQSVSQPTNQSVIQSGSQSIDLIEKRKSDFHK